MAVKNYDGSVTLSVRGSRAYTPSASGGISRAYVKPGAPGGLTGGSSLNNGRLQRQKGAGYSGRSAYS